MIAGVLLNIAIGFVFGIITLTLFPRTPAWVVISVAAVVGAVEAGCNLWG